MFSQKYLKNNVFPFPIIHNLKFRLDEVPLFESAQRLNIGIIS
jgi:hypothetical protein